MRTHKLETEEHEDLNVMEMIDDGVEEEQQLSQREAGGDGNDIGSASSIEPQDIQNKKEKDFK